MVDPVLYCRIVSFVPCCFMVVGGLMLESVAGLWRGAGVVVARVELWMELGVGVWGGLGDGGRRGERVRDGVGRWVEGAWVIWQLLCWVLWGWSRGGPGFVAWT